MENTLTQNLGPVSDMTFDGVNPLVIIHIEGGIVHSVVVPSGQKIGLLVVDLDAKSAGENFIHWPAEQTPEEFAQINPEAWIDTAALIFEEGGTVPTELSPLYLGLAKEVKS